MTAPPDLAAFQARLARLAADDRFSGAVTATSRGEQIFAAAYGYANRAWQAPCRLDTRFDTASITKLFTAVATLQLVERGEFDLGTSAVDYLELAGTTISPAVTPYHLLTHTSGIADDADEEAGERYEDLFVAEPSYSFTETADQLPHFVTKPPNFPPGQGCRYCNGGYLLLGLMIERATQAPYRDYVCANVFGPAGMTRSGFFRMDVVEPDVAEGVEPILSADQRIIGWRRNIYSYPPIGDPAGGAHATVGDLLAFHRALAAGQLLGPELTRAMLAPHEVHTRKPGLTRMTGYGFAFKLTADGRIRSCEKDGVNVGTSGLLRHYPDHDLTLAILGVGEDSVWEPVATFDAAVPIG
ncbi:serine hydrolase domain-containing protein [Dactylosporangium darangshiense]|uniref:Serine hydrolase domain-containing protein n=1 Tax=Dactylosporangium darangshiense TaxID=579108 RepID=A0ABP8DAY8_9ACTN